MKRMRLAQGQVDVVFNQEMKIQQMEDEMVELLWGEKETQWSTKNSVGASCGMLNMWSKGVVEPLFSFSSEGALGICAYFKGQVFYLANIYSSCLIEKRDSYGMK